MEDELEDEKLNTKHYRIRGTHDLKYPPNESRCHNTCGHYHDVIQARAGEKVLQHRCFLSINHRSEYCEFSSCCGELRVRRVSEAA